MNSAYNKIIIGLLIGLAVPFVGYAILLILLEQLAGIDSLSDLNFDFKSRTTALLAIALNLIPLRFFRNQRANQGIRGLLVATMLYAIAWITFFGIQFL